jgi:hypothetical protein
MEVDVAAGYREPGDVDAMIASLASEFSKVPESARVVIAADWRACQLFTPAVSARAVQMLSTNSTRIERSAILHSATQPTSVLQVFRLIREAGVLSDQRRIFTDANEMASWLDPVLTEEERARLQQFLLQRK